MTLAHPEWLLLGVPAALLWWLLLRHHPSTRVLRAVALAVLVIALATALSRGP